MGNNNESNEQQPKDIIINEIIKILAQNKLSIKESDRLLYETIDESHKRTFITFQE